MTSTPWNGNSKGIGGLKQKCPLVGGGGGMDNFWNYAMQLYTVLMGYRFSKTTFTESPIKKKSLMSCPVPFFKSQSRFSIAFSPEIPTTGPLKS